MPLLKTISGLRGTLGDSINQGLTPIDIVSSIAAYATLLKRHKRTPKIMLGRDGRISGQSISNIVIGTLSMCGVDVVDVGLSTTPTVAYVVSSNTQYDGGIIITASHNPENWNALKLLNAKGEFISQDDIVAIYDIVDNQNFEFAKATSLGSMSEDNQALKTHINATIDYPLVDKHLIKDAQFTVVADVINSSGFIALKLLFEQLDVKCHFLHADNEVAFEHDPEPLPQNLGALSQAVVNHKADLGIAVDPDVDRVCFVDEHGLFFGEEYTIVAIADYILQHRKGPLVSNLSSSQALSRVATRHKVDYHASKIGEVHVVEKMKDVKAIFGGEGNGGVIIPDFHYGRDAIIGIALFLTQLASSKQSISELKNRYPQYIMIKDKVHVDDKLKASILANIEADHQVNTIDKTDGIKIFVSEDSWVHIRSSNTEPIMRIIAEAPDQVKCQSLINAIKKYVS